MVDLRSQHRTHLDVERRVPVRPDRVLLDGARPVYVADAKYKLSDSGIARHADYYQALAYATALSLPEALLVYCHDDGDAPPTEITVRGSGVRLVTYRLDLSGGADDLARRTEALAAMIRDRARWMSAEARTLSSACGDQLDERYALMADREHPPTELTVDSRGFLVQRSSWSKRQPSPRPFIRRSPCLIAGTKAGPPSGRHLRGCARKGLPTRSHQVVPYPSRRCGGSKLQQHNLPLAWERLADPG